MRECKALAAFGEATVTPVIRFADCELDLDRIVLRRTVTNIEAPGLMVSLRISQSVSRDVARIRGYRCAYLEDAAPAPVLGSSLPEMLRFSWADANSCRWASRSICPSLFISCFPRVCWGRIEPSVFAVHLVTGRSLR